MDQSTQPQDQFSFYRQKPDGDIDPTGEAGWYLQRERERQGITLDQAGEACGIHPHHLQGIEDGDLTRLPPRTEALRMIGTYAQFLEFDPQPLILHYTQFLPQPMPIAKSAKPRRPHPLSSAKIIKFANLDKLRSYSSGAGGIVASVLVAVVVFQGIVFALSPSNPDSEVVQSLGTAQVESTKIDGVIEKTDGLVALSDDVTEASDGLIAKSDDAKDLLADQEYVASISKIEETSLGDSEDEQVSRITTETDQSAAGLSGLTEFIEKDVVNSQIPLPRVKPIRLSELPGVKPAAEPKVESVAVSASAPSSTTKVLDAENANSRLVLKAKAAVWVRIEDQQGNVVMTQTLNKGESYRVPARDGLIVIARDGGAISYAIDGVEKGPLGDVGEILVGRSLDLSSLATQS